MRSEQLAWQPASMASFDKYLDSCEEEAWTRMRINILAILGAGCSTNQYFSSNY